MRNRYYRILRISRIVIAVTAFAVITLFAVFPQYTGWLKGVAAWLASAQICEAIAVWAAAWLVIWTAITLLFGRIYCSTVCPLGTLQDVFSRLGMRKWQPRRQRAFRYVNGRPVLRLLVLIAYIEGLCIGATSILSFMNPHDDYLRLCTVFFATSAGAWAAAGVIAAVTAALSWRTGRMLCNTICPVGAALGAISRFAVLNIDINPDLCTHCHKCENVCKAMCVDSDKSIVDTSRCVTCFNCVAACENNAITWRRGRHKLQWPLLQAVSAPKPTLSAP